MKTIAISTRTYKTCGDELQDVLGLDITMEEAVKRCVHNWNCLVQQDQKNTKDFYVSIAQIPDTPIDPDDGVVYDYYDKSIVLPENWENDAESEDVVKDGKLVALNV
jgi:hypothetical protein|nr:MAG TPA: hypothetical protein [Caudoviricetes sp.]